MSGHEDLSNAGPDLAAGIPSHTLPEGAMIAGHAHGDPVLVARHDGKCYAIGAVCTHWSGNLVEGLLVGDTVRCPLHHACFSLATGEARRAPALDPVQTYHVEERDGSIVVLGKLDTAQPAAESLPPIKSAVIVGAGAAGVAAGEMLRRRGFTGTIDLIDAQPALPVDRPNLSKDFLSGAAEEAWVFLRPQEWFDERRLTLHLGKRVTRIDTNAHLVELSDGSQLPFDRLLLATGATPIQLPNAPAGTPNIHYLRTLDDSKSIIASATSKKRAVVIGASFIGLEVAASLRARGVEVHVVAPEQRPLERIVGAELGDMVRAKHVEEGVIFHLGQTAKTIALPRVELSDGSTLDADFVVVGVGVRPEMTLAESIGLRTDKGVLVDEYLETSVPGIFAAGDIAKWPDRHTGQPLRVEHWVVAQRQGQVAACNMLGARTAFDAVPYFWSTHYDVSIDYVGHAEKWEQLRVDGDPSQHDCKVEYRNGDTLLAVATVGRDTDSLRCEVAMERR